MKTQSADRIQLVAKFAEIRDIIKSLSKEQEEIRTQIKGLMGDDNLLEAGELIVLLSERSRKNLDVESIVADHGPEFLEDYYENISYQIMEVKKR